MRCHTELSHDLSKVAVNVVISELQKLMPNSPIFDKILQLVQNPIVAPMPIIEDTHDAKRLKIIFSELTSCKDDAQQRSWMLHEDEAVIIEYVKELTSILVRYSKTFLFKTRKEKMDFFFSCNEFFFFKDECRFQYQSTRNFKRSVFWSSCSRTILSNGNKMEHKAASFTSTWSFMQFGSRNN